MAERPEPVEPDTPLEEEAPPARPSARVLAFEALYESDLARHSAERVLERLALDQGAGETMAQGARELLAGVLAEKPTLDATITRLAPAWPLAQMSAVDRNILRLGLLEIGRASSAALERAAINAAIDLARLYGGDSSPRFVRGVLGRAAEQRRSPDPPGKSNPPGPKPRTL
jgi:N utilization substance protein B